VLVDAFFVVCFDWLVYVLADVLIVVLVDERPGGGGGGVGSGGRGGPWLPPGFFTGEPLSPPGGPLLPPGPAGGPPGPEGGPYHPRAFEHTDHSEN
jgi:hypothetical protein